MKKVVNAFIFGILLLISCSNTLSDEERKIDYQKRIDAIPRVVASAIYSKDSLQIINSVRWGLDNDSYFFNFQKQLGVNKTKHIDLYVDRIFYAPDSSKLLAVVILKEPKHYLDNSDAPQFKGVNYVYSGIIIVSSRNNNGQWVLVPVDWYRISDFTSYEDVKYRYYYFLLENMLSKPYFDYYQCTIDQDCFWSERNGYWRMGEIIPGYYNYEVSTHRDYFKATGRKVDSTNIKEYLHRPLQEY